MVYIPACLASISSLYCSNLEFGRLCLLNSPQMMPKILHNQISMNHLQSKACFLEVEKDQCKITMLHNKMQKASKPLRSRPSIQKYAYEM